MRRYQKARIAFTIAHDMADAIHTRALRKVYPAPHPKRKRGAPAPPPSGGIVALDALDLDIREGEFFGLLGPNGAGKTTTIGILTTRVNATSGEAIVAGANVTTEPAAVRLRIGVVPQRPNPDRGLSVVENLIFHASYFGVTRAEATKRAERRTAAAADDRARVVARAARHLPR